MSLWWPKQITDFLRRHLWLSAPTNAPASAWSPPRGSTWRNPWKKLQSLRAERRQQQFFARISQKPHFLSLFEAPDDNQIQRQLMRELLVFLRREAQAYIEQSAYAEAAGKHFWHEASTLVAYLMQHPAISFDDTFYLARFAPDLFLSVVKKRDEEMLLKQKIARTQLDNTHGSASALMVSKQTQQESDESIIALAGAVTADRKTLRHIRLFAAMHSYRNFLRLHYALVQHTECPADIVAGYLSFDDYFFDVDALYSFDAAQPHLSKVRAQQQNPEKNLEDFDNFLLSTEEFYPILSTAGLRIQAMTDKQADRYGHLLDLYYKLGVRLQFTSLALDEDKLAKDPTLTADTLHQIAVEAYTRKQWHICKVILRHPKVRTDTLWHLIRNSVEMPHEPLPEETRMTSSSRHEPSMSLRLSPAMLDDVMAKFDEKSRDFEMMLYQFAQHPEITSDQFLRVLQTQYLTEAASVYLVCLKICKNPQITSPILQAIFQYCLPPLPASVLLVDPDLSQNESLVSLTPLQEQIALALLVHDRTTTPLLQPLFWMLREEAARLLCQDRLQHDGLLRRLALYRYQRSLLDENQQQKKVLHYHHYQQQQTQGLSTKQPRQPTIQNMQSMQNAHTQNGHTPNTSGKRAG